MTTDSDTTLANIRPLKTERFRPTLRLLYDGTMGPCALAGIAIPRQPITVGRSAEVKGIRLDDPRASRYHVTLWSRAGGKEVLFEDQSTNGTFINGRRIRRGELNDGDVIRVGDSFLLVRFLSEELNDGRAVSSVVGDAPSIQHLRRTILMVAPTDATVLVVGETGTGKELVARAIHENSERKGSFVAVNCSAIPATLAESQLFGHVAGSFTGAARDHQGFFRAAQGGTLFLDELGELPPPIQPKLLRVLEDRTVLPVGAFNPIPVDVRIVAATNRDLEGALADDQFRGDLFARLAEITIQTPPLRARREDILRLFALGFGPDMPSLAPDLVDALLLHPWPFNVRELFKAAKELRIVGAGKQQLKLALVEHRFSRRGGSIPGEAPVDQPTGESEQVDGPGSQSGSRDSQRYSSPSANQPLSRVATTDFQVDVSRQPIPTREVVEDLLRKFAGNISELGRQLGRSRRQIYRYLRMYDLDVEDFRD
jgi:DNA-binding NtrC family response regulator